MACVCLALGRVARDARSRLFLGPLSIECVITRDSHVNTKTHVRSDAQPLGTKPGCTQSKGPASASAPAASASTASASASASASSASAAQTASSARAASRGVPGADCYTLWEEMGFFGAKRKKSTSTSIV